MIVQCPSCASRYRVNDANIPPSGGKIRCPSCAHAFVVYPEAAQDPVGHDDAEDKTSIAERPNLQELLSAMQQGGGQASQPQGGAPVEEEVAKTEVMSGAQLPDFSSLFGGTPPDGDQTVEMSNPLFNKSAPPSPNNPTIEEDDLHTQELNSDIVQASLNHVRGQVESRPPVETPEDDEPSTQIAPPPMVNQLPPMQQQRASAPSGPTPPPAGQVRPGPSSPQGFGSTPAPSRAPSSPGGAGVPPTGQQQQPPAQQPPAQAGAGGPDPNHAGPWKLQTNFGLTYEFSDNTSLRKWLDSRDDLEGYKLSGDGNEFYPLDQFPQVRGGAGQSGGNRNIASSGSQAPIPGTSSGPQQASPGGAPPPARTTSGAGMHGGPGSGPNPSRSPFSTAAAPAVAGPGNQSARQADQSREKINPNESFRPPSRDGKLANVVLWGAFGLLAVAAVVLALDLADVIDLFGGDEPEQTQEIVEQQPEPVIDEETAPEEEAAQPRVDPQEVDRIVELARTDMESNRLTSALERLERAQRLDPQRIGIYVMMAEIHETLGSMEEAETMRQRAQELRDQGTIDPPPSDE